MYIRYAILPQQYTKLFLVGNYGDLLEKPETLERMRAMLSQRTSLLLPGEKTYLISALDELCRAQEQERPCQELAPILEQEFEQLRQAIMELIQEKKTVVAADRMLRMTSMMVEEIKAYYEEFYDYTLTQEQAEGILEANPEAAKGANFGGSAR